MTVMVTGRQDESPLPATACAWSSCEVCTVQHDPSGEPGGSSAGVRHRAAASGAALLLVIPQPPQLLHWT
jgi:hypothetical protein